MTASLSDRWIVWWEEHAREGSASNTSQDLSVLPLQFVEKALRKDHALAELSLPGRRLLAQRLSHDLEPLDTHEKGRR